MANNLFQGWFFPFLFVTWLQISLIYSLFIMHALNTVNTFMHFGEETILHITFCTSFAKIWDFWPVLQGLLWRGGCFFMPPDWMTAVTNSASWNRGQESGAYPFLTSALHPQSMPSTTELQLLRMGSRTIDLAQSFVYFALEASNWWILSLFLYLFCFWDFQRKDTNLKGFFPSRMQNALFKTSME